VAAFRSTLQEAREADLLLHVIDAADPERTERIRQVNEVLESVGAQGLPQVAVYNKIDRTGEAPRAETDAHGRIDRIWLSAHGGQGIDLLLGTLHAQLGSTCIIACSNCRPRRAARAPGCSPPARCCASGCSRTAASNSR